MKVERRPHLVGQGLGMLVPMCMKGLEREDIL